ncbi:MAG: hypothetical protein M3309_06950 [Actinomycetota bacterium]|nr:hypothetical protein [Actinomycetota bacterium]
MMHKTDDYGWKSMREQVWDEPEAVRLLKRAGDLVTSFEASGARMPQRKLYHARLVAAHDARDMTDYRDALNGYVEAARMASREAARQKTKKGFA